MPFWVPGLDYARKFLTAHVATWIVQQTGCKTVDELWLLYCEFRASGLQLDHECSNPGCRNPDHVKPCTQSENIMAGRDRAAARALARDLEAKTRPMDEFEEDEPLPF